MQAYSANGEFTADNTEQMSFDEAPPVNEEADTPSFEIVEKYSDDE